MERFAGMYRARRFDADAFDLDAGHLQTTLSDEARMPLLLRAAQHVHFAEGKIVRIRTYASGAFFMTPTPLVELDRHGNSVWLETGYDLATSTAAAQVFLRSPSGLAFAAKEPTAAPIARIKANLAALTDRLSAW
jgi:hypothetical protein